MSDKIRLDQRIVQLGLLESREKAKAMIMAGQVGGMSAQALRSFCHECTDPFDNRGQK